jgi:uncharacterized protein YbaR (Trm112 family)
MPLHKCGYYSNKSRGMRKKPTLMSWDLLVCPKCNGKMKVIALIGDVDVTKKILLKFMPDQAQHIEQVSLTCSFIV